MFNLGMCRKERKGMSAPGPSRPVAAQRKIGRKRGTGDMDQPLTRGWHLKKGLLRPRLSAIIMSSRLPASHPDCRAVLIRLSRYRAVAPPATDGRRYPPDWRYLTG